MHLAAGWHPVKWMKHDICDHQLVDLPMQEDSAAVRGKKMKATGAYAEAERIGPDGLPHVGAVLYPGQAYYSTLDPQSGMS